MSRRFVPRPSPLGTTPARDEGARLPDAVPQPLPVMVRDVTDAQLAGEAPSRVAALEAAGREKDLFLAMLSHELRTPLNAILLWSQVLRRDTTLAPEARRAAQGIEQSARAEAQLLDDMLDVARILSGDLPVTRESVEVGPLVLLAVSAFRAEAASRSIALDTTIASPAARVLGDAKRLRQVARALSSNALKFTPSGGHVEVRLSRPDGAVELTVRDDGIGIDPAFLPRLFERFAQEDSRTTRAHGGIGLGLSLARSLVSAHGGTIRGENNAGGRGTTFTVSLPTP